jgi:flagellar basal-body rod modification protein FlgD
LTTRRNGHGDVLAKAGGDYVTDIVSTQNVWPNYAKGNVEKAAAKTKDGMLGKDDFLKILITQLQNQDPMQPLQDKEFIAQMAQFTSVEQLTNMGNEMKLLRQSMGMAPGLIGKSVSWKENDSQGVETVKVGIVDALTFKGGIQFANIGESSVSLDRLIKITNPEG